MHIKTSAYRFGYEGDFEMRATTLAGLEDLLTKELLQLGARNILKFQRGASFTGDRGFLYKLHLMSALSIKVLIPILEFNCGNEKEYYACLYDFHWEDWLTPRNTFAFECVGESEWLQNRMYGAMRAKDALCDRIRKATGRRPFVDKTSPDFYYYLHVQDNKAALFLNASGDVLHRRGYRKQQGHAPLNELLAAALIKLSDPKGHRFFVDGMCGSGTLGIECCLETLKIPRGIFREQFAFMNFPDFDEDLWNKILESKTEKILEPDDRFFLLIDHDPEVLKKTKANVRAAKLEDVIKIEHKDFFNIVPPASSGKLYLNPPYGIRLNADEEDFFRKLGSRIKHHWKGWEAWMIIPESAYSLIGLRHKKRLKVMNGNIPCYLCGYDLF